MTKHLKDLFKENNNYSGRSEMDPSSKFWFGYWDLQCYAQEEDLKTFTTHIMWLSEERRSNFPNFDSKNISAEQGQEIGDLKLSW